MSVEALSHKENSSVTVNSVVELTTVYCSSLVESTNQQHDHHGRWILFTETAVRLLRRRARARIKSTVSSFPCSFILLLFGSLPIFSSSLCVRCTISQPGGPQSYSRCTLFSFTRFTERWRRIHPMGIEFIWMDSGALFSQPFSPSRMVEMDSTEGMRFWRHEQNVGDKFIMSAKPFSS